MSPWNLYLMMRQASLSLIFLSLVQQKSTSNDTENTLQNFPLHTCFSLNSELNTLLWKTILFMACLRERAYHVSDTQINKHITLIWLLLRCFLTKLIETPYDKHTNETLIAAQVTSGKQKPKSHADPYFICVSVLVSLSLWGFCFTFFLNCWNNTFTWGLGA